MNSEQQIIARIYLEKIASINKLVSEWWEQKVVSEAERNNFQKNMAEHIKSEIETTMVSFRKMFKTFSEQRLGSKPSSKSAVGSTKLADNIQPKDETAPSKQNTTEIAYFLQRVEKALGTQLNGYERMAAEVIRSTQIRLKFIDDNLQNQRRAIAEKTKITKGTVSSPYTYMDILKLGGLVDSEIQSRMLMRNEIDEVVAILANEEYKVYSCFKDNLQVFSKQYPGKFNQSSVYPGLLNELKKFLESKELYVLKYYVKGGMLDLKTEEKVQEARLCYQEFKLQTKQTLENKINFAKIYKYFIDEIIIREWNFAVPYDLLNDQWTECKGLMTVNGGLIIVNQQKQLVNEFNLSKLEYCIEKAFVLKLVQKQEKKGIMKKFFEGSRKNEVLIKFVNTDQIQIFELYCKKWK